mgnify:CR=1 FL=1
MKNYLVQLTVFTAIVAGIMLLVGLQLFPGKVDATSWMTFLYFIVVTFLFHLGLMRSSEGRPQTFVRFYMASTVMKLMLHLGVILIYAFLHRSDAFHFIATFTMLYFVFTAFEVSVIYRKK